jgi:hypothetical protein
MSDEPIGPVEAHVTGEGFTPPLPEDEESAIIDEEMRATEAMYKLMGWDQ